MNQHRDLSLVILVGLVTGIAAGSLSLSRAHAFDRTGETITAHEFRLVDANGKTGADLGYSPDGPPGLFLFDTKGRNRAQLSVPPGGNAALALYDDHWWCKGLFRLDGANQSPLLILKDNDTHLRAILGLDLSGPNHNSFLAYFDDSNAQHDVIGKFHR